MFVRIITLFLFCFTLFTYSYKPEGDITKQEPYISAEAYIVMNANTGEVLYEKNKDKPFIPASTLKVLSALVILKHENPYRLTRVSEKAANQEGSTMYLKAGQTATVIDLLYGMLMCSGNDAAYALAEHSGGTVRRFVDMMNNTARALGLANTHVVDPHGLSSLNQTTAYDLARITRVAFQYRLFNTIVKTKEKRVILDSDIRRIQNKNKLLYQNEYADGVKTGFTQAAGHTYIGSETRNGIRIITVILRSPKMYQDAQTLLTMGFNRTKPDYL